MRFIMCLFAALALLSVVFATDEELLAVQCLTHGNGLFPADGRQYITTIFCSSDSAVSFTLSGKLVFPASTPYHATYYLKDATGAFTEITPDTKLQFSSVSRNKISTATLELYAETTTTSTEMLTDVLAFDFSDLNLDIGEFYVTPLHYMTTTTDALTLFKLNSQLHPAVTESTSDEDLKKIVDYLNSIDEESNEKYFTFSMPLLCQKSSAERVKKLNIDSLGEMCYSHAVMSYLEVTTGRFLDIYFDSVDEAGQFNFPMDDYSSLAIMLSFFGRFKDLEKLTLPEDEDDSHKLSNIVKAAMEAVTLEDYPTMVYSILRSFGDKPYVYKAAVERYNDTHLKLDVISVIQHVYDPITSQLGLDLEGACKTYFEVVNFENIFKNTYQVEKRLETVAPTDENVFDRVIEFDQLDYSLGLTCNRAGNFGKSMSYYLSTLMPQQITDEMKATAITQPVSADSVRAYNEFNFYDITNKGFLDLPELYFKAYDDYNGPESNPNYRKFMLTYIFDAFTALAEVVGPSQKAISALFTGSLYYDGSHFLEALSDVGSETTSLEFAVKLMKGLYVDPCSYENPTYASDAVKKVVDVVCSCNKVIFFIETAATCDDVPAGSFYYFPADAVRPVAWLCPAGTKQPEINQTACLPCEADEICEVPGVVIPDKKAPGLTTGAIAAIAVGAVVVVAALGGGAFFIIKKKKSANRDNLATQL